MKVKVKSLSRVQLFVNPWTVAHQAPPSVGFSRQEYWSGLPFSSPKLVVAQIYKIPVGFLSVLQTLILRISLLIYSRNSICLLHVCHSSLIKHMNLIDYILQISGPQPFWHQIQWKRIFPQTRLWGARDGSGGNASDKVDRFLAKLRKKEIRLKLTKIKNE